MTGKKFINHYFKKSRELESSYIEQNGKLSSFSLKIRGRWPKCDPISINDSNNIIMKVNLQNISFEYITNCGGRHFWANVHWACNIFVVSVLRYACVCVFVCVLCIHIFLFNHLDNFISIWQMRKLSHSTITQSHAWLTPSFTWRRLLWKIWAL